MTIGVGGKSEAEALAALSDMTAGAVPIGESEYRQRIAKAQAYMQAHGIAAITLHPGSNLAYFTGMRWHPSERMVAAVLPAEGAVQYIAPKFEEGTLKDNMVIEGPVECWQEHESPYALLLRMLEPMGGRSRYGLCESTPFFMFDEIRKLGANYDFINAAEVTRHCRAAKSAAEIALMQRAKDMTLEVQKAAASILREGISTTEVEAFIAKAHRQVGAPGSTFCIVLFGVATSFPHGVKDPQILRNGDMVLIDTGCRLHNYLSDITRTYVFGEPTERQRKFWNIEKDAQAAAFAKAQLGTTCKEVDRAARASLAAAGLSAGYDLPGLPHRTGHGIGLDIHEGPYLVGNEETPLAPGMCFSNEPMICVPGEFGIRLEDHFYMTETGPKWFTRPAHSVDDPFGLAA
jgi:Xaa-Pro dipeptidase